MKEDKARICLQLAKMLGMTRAGECIRAITYSQDDLCEYASIEFDEGIKTIDVTAESGIAMIKHIMKEIS